MAASRGWHKVTAKQDFIDLFVVVSQALCAALPQDLAPSLLFAVPQHRQILPPARAAPPLLPFEQRPRFSPEAVPCLSATMHEECLLDFLQADGSVLAAYAEDRKRVSPMNLGAVEGNETVLTVRAREARNGNRVPLQPC